MAGRDFLSDDSFVRDVSVEMTKPQGETTWFVSYPERTDINLSKVPSCALCLTAAIHEQLALRVHKNGALTCLQCTSRLRPESPLTDKWQQRVSRCFAHSVRKTLTDTSRTQNPKRTTSQVQLTPCFLPTAVSHFTSAAWEMVWVTNDSKGLMPPHTCVCLLVSLLSPCSLL